MCIVPSHIVCIHSGNFGVEPTDRSKRLRLNILVEFIPCKHNTIYEIRHILMYLHTDTFSYAASSQHAIMYLCISVESSLLTVVWSNGWRAQLPRRNLRYRFSVGPNLFFYFFFFKISKIRLKIHRITFI